jgi:hypothetical protein
VITSAAYDDGSGTALFVGGEFTIAGGVTTGHIAKWNGSTWSGLGSGIGNTVSAMTTYDDGSGSRLFVAGTFSMAGGVPASRIASWDGTFWRALGAGVDGTVRALKVYDDGTGPALFVSGEFNLASGLLVNKIAKWDGSTWTDLAGGVAGPFSPLVSCLEVFDDGNGPMLYVGGTFTSAGGVSVQNFARWDGAAWSAVDPAVVTRVSSLPTVDDGRGPALVASGLFQMPGSTSTVQLARWDGVDLSPLGTLEGGVNAWASFDQGGERRLFCGGSFLSISGVPSFGLAGWKACTPAGQLFCLGDGSSGSCPCVNGRIGRGCENSRNTGGVQLTASGATNPDSLSLSTTAAPDQALVLFLQGDVHLASIPFGDGLRCMGGRLKRMYFQQSQSGDARVPPAGSPSITSRSAILGDPIQAGSTRYYQAYYRDPDPSFCAPPQGSYFNVSNAVEIRW